VKHHEQGEIKMSEHYIELGILQTVVNGVDMPMTMDQIMDEPQSGPVSITTAGGGWNTLDPAMEIPQMPLNAGYPMNCYLTFTASSAANPFLWIWSSPDDNTFRYTIGAPPGYSNGSVLLQGISSGGEWYMTLEISSLTAMPVLSRTEPVEP
jgi:hypothetical protein